MRLSFCLALSAGIMPGIALCQSAVTTNGGATTSIPVFTGTFNVAPSNLYTANGGNVGIGTGNPVSRLHIMTPGTDLYGYGKSADGSGDLLLQGLLSGRSPNNGVAMTFAFPANTDGSNNWEQARIFASPDNSSNGNAAGRMSLQTRWFSPNGWAWQNNLVLASNGSTGLRTSNPFGTLTVASPAQDGQGSPNYGIVLSDSLYGDPGWGHAAIYSVGSSGYNGSLVFATDGNFAPDYAFQERMRIGYNGNVGIGTASPSSRLEVNGGITITPGSGAGIVFADGSVQSTAASSNIYQSGNRVGIGTNTPQTALDVNGTLSFSGGYPNFSLNAANRLLFSETTAPSDAGSAYVFGSGSPSRNNTMILAKTGVASAFWGLNGNAVLFGTEGARPLVFKNQVAYSSPDIQSSGVELMRLSPEGFLGLGTPNPTSRLEVNGSLTLTQNSGASIKFQDGTTQATAWTGSLSGGDYAESVDVTGDRQAFEPGDLLAIDPEHDGRFLKVTSAYSTLVGGVYATKPGIVGRRQPNSKSAEDEVPMAMVGIVPTKVTTENGPIHRGDLLVSSSTPGFAMRGTDRERLTGAVIGKALGELKDGKGLIEVLISLQ